MRKNKVWIFFLAAMLLLASCASALSRDKSSRAGNGVNTEMAAPMAASVPGASSQKAADESLSTSSESETPSSDDSSIERIVIKNANLSIAVKDPVSSMQTISKMAEEMGGYMVSSNTYKTTTYNGIEVPTASITVRVPAGKLDDALSQIKGLVEDTGTDIINENVTGQDVTSQVNDLDSQLRNSQAAETQLLDIMSKAKTTEDVMTVFQELKAVRQEIEVLQGQIKYYKESASLSAISVDLQAKEAIEPITVAGWKPGLQAQKALQSLVKGGQYLVNFLIWFVIFALPLLAVIFLPIYFIVKAVRNRKANKINKKVEKQD
jgi:hypothetical protein